MLTADTIRTITEPGLYYDNGTVTGFACRVNHGGGKTFVIRYWRDGRERQHRIGTFPLWSLGAAREEAKELRKQIDRGLDPAGDKRERREAPTIQDLIDRYIADHLPKKSLRGARINDEKRMLVEIGEKLGRHTKVSDVHGGDVAGMHRRITESGRPVRANRIHAVASKMFAMSLVPMPGENAPWRSADLGNPCKGIERNHEEGRERFFSQLELVAIGEALSGYPGITAAADCVRLIMFTGARPAEAMQATWSEFDTEPGYWVKPSSHTKQRKVHRLPLNPPALELINRLRKERKDEQWVFPGSGSHVQTLRHVWDHVRQKTNIGKSARPYDLRHTFASVGAGGGLSLLVIGKLLGHSEQHTTQRYAHLADDPLREATAKIGNVIADRPGAEVVSIKR